MNDAIRALVDAIEPLDAAETAHRLNVLDWIDSGAGLFRLRKPATPPKHLVSYCVLVDTRAQRVLLVDHRDAQRWLPTGGHVDPGEHPAAAATREIREELGIEPAFVDTRWWDFDEVRHGPDTRFDPHLPRFIEKLALTEARP